MSPPPVFDLFLLGCWVLMMFAVTNQIGYDQLRTAQQAETELHATQRTEPADEVAD